MFEPDHRVTTEDAEGVVEVEVVADEYFRLGLNQLGIGKPLHWHSIKFKTLKHIAAYNPFSTVSSRSFKKSPSLIFKLSRIKLAVGGHNAAAACPSGHRNGPVFDIVGAVHAHHVADPEADLE